MDEDMLFARTESGVTIAVTTKSPYFCVGGATAMEARAIADRARAYYRSSARPQPIAAGPVGKPDYVKPVREG